MAVRLTAGRVIDRLVSGGSEGQCWGDTSPGGLVQGVKISGKNVTEQSQTGLLFGGEGVNSVLHIDRELLTVSSWSGLSGQGGKGALDILCVARGL